MNRILLTLILVAAAISGKAQTKTLVAYFSAQGHTEAVANRIVELTGADVYKIEASQPYASNPYDDSERIQNEAYNNLRPGVANLPDSATIAKYDTIFVGTPTWWHQPAMVVCTFLESYDLSGKLVIPFVTYAATTYLNEVYHRLFASTPNSFHYPLTLPEDIDPDNIQQPQSDDSGIDNPLRASQVEDWLERIHNVSAVTAINKVSSQTSNFIRGVYNLNGVKVADNMESQNLQKGLYIVKGEVTSKVIVK